VKSLGLDRIPCELPQRYQDAHHLAEKCNLVGLIESDDGKMLLEQYNQTVRSIIQPDYGLERYGSELLNIINYDKKKSILTKTFKEFCCKFQKLVSICESCEHGLAILCDAMMISAHRFNLIRPMKPSDEAVSKFSKHITV
jgi:hypothetical protein